MTAEGEKGTTLATNLASYLRDSVKLSFKPGAFRVDQIYDAAQMLDSYDALLTQRDALEAQVVAMQAVVNAASVLEHTWNGEYEADTTAEEFALWDAIKIYRTTLSQGAGL